MEQMNSRRGKRISRLLNLAEANASFVGEGIVKQGIPVQRSCLDAKARDHLLMRERVKGTDRSPFGATKWNLILNRSYSVNSVIKKKLLYLRNTDISFKIKRIHTHTEFSLLIILIKI